MNRFGLSVLAGAALLLLSQPRASGAALHVDNELLDAPTILTIHGTAGRMVPPVYTPARSSALPVLANAIQNLSGVGSLAHARSAGIPSASAVSAPLETQTAAPAEAQVAAPARSQVTPVGTQAAALSSTPAVASDAATEPVASSPQQAVLLDPDVTVNKKLAQNSGANGTSFSTTGTAAATTTDSTPKRRGLSAPLDPVFPSVDYPGIATTFPIGVPDTDPEFPLEKEIYKVLPALRAHKIKIYGWINPGIDKSSSRNSNIPNSYAIVPNRIELDQAIFRVERCPDTVQTQHCDWGFRTTMLYGIDYRWTTSEGWYPATKELLQHNYLYGADPVELYGMFYVPKVAQGLALKFGRFISPPDIEAQLAPDNFLWTHSQMFTADCYTQTGMLATIKLNDNWNLQGAISAGTDMAPWDKGAIPTGLFLARWVSKNNNDSLYGGFNSFNNGRFRGARAVLADQQMVQAVNTQIAQGVANGAQGFVTANGQPFQYANLKPEAHDNLQQLNLTWSHRFNKKGTIVTMSEIYFLYQYNALVGGTVNNGPPHTYAGLTGPGAYINGIAPAIGLVNYTAFKLTNRDYICVRPVDYLIDYKGERTGFPTALSSWTVGWCHRFNDLVLIRPEIRYDRALNTHDGTVVTPYDNGTRRFQFTFGLDCIARF